jgi:dihydrofolate reductase
MLYIIVAADENGAIGLGGQMPWHLPADLKYFKATTLGHPVIMGRKTYASIGRPLPGRRNLVVSRQEGLQIEGCEVYPSLEAAAAAVAPAAEAPAEAADLAPFIIGGAQIYRQAWPLADRIYLTRVHTRVADYDAAIPAIDPAAWTRVSATDYPADEKNAFDLTFEVYERK